MAQNTLFLALIAAPAALAYPWVARMPGVDSSMLGARSQASQFGARDSPQCPNNPNHVPAPLVTDQYPYNGAKNGKPGNGKGGYLVPAPGDTVHYFQAPGPLDIRGPCPGINTAANHGFLARDGITTYNELVDMQQNVYNVGYDLANILAVAGVGLDGDLVGTTKLSIGCDATSRTSLTGGLLADELGLNGHNHFEADTSLTRNDYFLAPEPGNNFKYNNTLFTMMMQTCNGNCNLQTLGEYRYQRYLQSRADNGNFFFGPGSLLLYGAATFLYELFPSAESTGSGDEATMMSFFGANKDANGNYYQNSGERIPPNWRARTDPYDGLKVGAQIIAMYLERPVLFGGNVGPGNFDALNFSSYITNGTLNQQTPSYALCLIYQTITSGFPAEVGNIVNLPVALETAIANILDPMFANFGCPRNHNSGGSVSGD
ncbi:hypothetical protein PRZ48_009135 [Zasmidium cellare]|uniref:Heme haloperoxidase family profile domain-containing protein n=1 Tax=Zasmidium cellare TaxID=395010 RepID=A0ABR0EBG5_ZASCE|nr:hypothetical protein PRZ48_009135 [Zasmidium cellare]